MAIVLNSTLHKINKECTCVTCSHLWKRNSHKNAAQISHLSTNKSSAEVTQSKLNRLVRKGDRVLVNGAALKRKGERSYPGTVQYIGLIEDHLSAPKMRVGVCLYDNVYSGHNGTYQGKRYFFCPRGHGAIIRFSDIQPLNPVPRTWPLSGNPMFPSYEGVKKNRILREQKIKDAEVKLCKEHEARRREQMQRFSKSTAQLTDSDNANKLGACEIMQEDGLDKNSVVSNDYLTRDRQNQALNRDTKSLEQIQLKHMKKAFGGDEKAERMAQTLIKLRRAFEEGRLIALGEKE